MSYFSPHRPTFSNEYLVFLRELSSNLTSKAQTFKSVCQGGGGGILFFEQFIVKTCGSFLSPSLSEGRKNKYSGITVGGRIGNHACKCKKS